MCSVILTIGWIVGITNAINLIDGLDLSLIHISILKDVPKERQTILFSATMNKRILNIASKYLNHPKNIKIKATELTVQNIEQTSIDMKQGMKRCV